MTQETALKILKTGRSAFITGSAGSGKTHLMRKYISWLKENDIPVGITASTGIAATHMHGITIHAWSGIGIRDSLDSGDIQAISEKSYLKSRIKKTEVLIIDEVSMLHDFRLDMVERVVRKIKGNDAPFGGIQVVLVGDFFQLPPIKKTTNQNPQQSLPEIQIDKESEFAYHSKAWKALDPAICYLHEQHRQEDSDFVEILNAIRQNSITKEHKSKLESKISKADNSSTTKLYAKNTNVDRINNEELSKIDGEVYTYKMLESGPEALTSILKNGCLAPEELRLKVGAKVMFVKNNYDQGFVNGSQGEVLKCSKDSIRVKLKSGEIIDTERMDWSIDDDGKTKAKITQFPLRLAWAITIHKSQGMSLDSAEIDLSDSFEKGMGYVALSRVRTLSGISLIGLNAKALEVHSEAFEYDKKWQEESALLTGAIESMNEKDLEEITKEFIKRTSHKNKEKKKDTKEITLELLLDGMSLKEIANKREYTMGTILDHIEELKEADPTIPIYHLRNEMPISRWKTIYSAFQKVGIVEGKRPLKPVMEALKGKYTYEELRIVRLFL